jgi:hypothetical protein
MPNTPEIFYVIDNEGAQQVKVLLKMLKKISFTGNLPYYHIAFYLKWRKQQPG